MMSTWQRRDERRREHEEHCRAQEEEAARIETLPLWMRIQDAETFGDIRAILTVMCQRLGIDDI